MINTPKELVAYCNAIFKDWIEKRSEKILVDNGINKINEIQKIRATLLQFQNTEDCSDLVKEINEYANEFKSSDFSTMLNGLLLDIYRWEIKKQQIKPSFDDWLDHKKEKFNQLNDSGYDTEVVERGKDEDEDEESYSNSSNYNWR